MKKKKLIIIGLVVAIIIVAGIFAVRFAVDFIFDKYIFNSAISALPEEKTETDATPEPAPEKETTPEESGGGETVSAGAEAKTKLSNSEIISRVMKSSELTHKMASMVSYEDKRRVLQIVLSNFTNDELAEIAKNVKGGLTSEYKSKMIGVAQSRLTSAQWSECLSIAYKYIDQIRPYVE